MNVTDVIRSYYNGKVVVMQVSVGECTELGKYHDQYGNCTSCDICRVSMCPKDDGAVSVDGDCYHKACYVARHRQLACQAILKLRAEIGALDSVDDEAMLTGKDLLDAGFELSEAYDGFFYLDRYATRNLATLKAAAETGDWS